MLIENTRCIIACCCFTLFPTSDSVDGKHANIKEGVGVTLQISATETILITQIHRTKKFVSIPIAFTIPRPKQETVQKPRVHQTKPVFRLFIEKEKYKT